MALLPARRNSTLSRPGSQPPARRDPFAGSRDLYQQMGQLMGGASGDSRQPLAQSWAPLAGPSETSETYLAEAELPGVARDDISAGLRARIWSQRRVPRPWPARPAAAPRAALGPVPVAAALADGVLTVTVPKAESGKPHRIQITAG